MILFLSDAMRILHTVELYHPTTGGSQEVVRQLSERLVRRGHEVTVSTSRHPARKGGELNGVRIEQFDVKGNMVKGITGEKEIYLDLVRDGDFDVMMNYGAQVWTTDLVLPIVDRLSMKKVLVPCGFSCLNLASYATYFKNMASWMDRYDACVFMSETYRDMEFARQSGITSRVVIPNGASEEEFGRASRIDIRRRLGIPEDTFLILTVGSHTGQKGHQESIAMFRKVRFKNSVLLIAANDPGTGCAKKCRLLSIATNSMPQSILNKKRIIVEELSREETIAAYQSADLFLFPSLIECSPLVLFESMASATPFLSTDVGNASEIVDWSKGGMILPTIKTSNGFSSPDIPSSVELIELLHRDPAGRQALGHNGREAWKERFTWERITSRYEELYADLVREDGNERERLIINANIN